MNHTLRLRHRLRRLVSIGLLAIVIGLVAKDVFASHFRYGTITWTIENPAQPRVVKVRFSAGFRWSYPWGVSGFQCPPPPFAPPPGGTGFGSCPPVGTVIPAAGGENSGLLMLTTNARVGTSQTLTASVPVSITVTSVNQTEDWLTGTFETTLTFPESVPFGTDVTVTYRNTNRITTLQNGNADLPYIVRSVITLRDPQHINQPPVASTLPIVRVAAGQTTQFPIPAVDPDGDPLTYRFATTAESGLATPVPPGMTLDATTGMVTYVAPALTAPATSALHAVQIVVTDSHGALTVVDLLVDRRSLTGQPPVVRINGSTAAGIISTLRNSPVTFTVSASDPENTPIMLVGTGLPIGSTLTPSLPVTQVNPSTTFTWTPTASGSYVLNFSGLDGDGRQTANSMTVNVANASVAAPTTTTVSVSPATALTSQAVTFTATVDTGSYGPAPGSLQFFVDGVLASTQQLTPGVDSTATALFSTPAPVGAHSVTATYGGATANDTLYQTSTSAPASFAVVQQADTTTVLSDLSLPSVFGQGVTLTAFVSPATGVTATPVGTVAFSAGSLPLGSATLVNGVATLVTTALPVGTNAVVAAYQGAAEFHASTSAPASHVVSKASTSTVLSSSPTPSTWPQPVTITATVSAVAPGAGTPAGTVSFYDGPTLIATVPLSGNTATVTNPPAFDAGDHALAAVYNGSDSFESSTGVTAQVVEKATAPTTVTGPSTSVYGESPAFTIVVGAPGNASRAVRLLDGALAIAGPATLDTSLPNGELARTFVIDGLDAGVHMLTGEALETPNVRGGTATLQHTVQPAATAVGLLSSPMFSSVGQPITLTANVVRISAPFVSITTGTVTFHDGAAMVAGPIAVNASGVATATLTSALAAGVHSLTAQFTPTNGNYLPASGSTLHVVTAATQTTIEAPASAVVGVEFPMTVTIAWPTTVPPPAGTLTVSVQGGSTLRTLRIQGSSTVTGSAIAVSIPGLSLSNVGPAVLVATFTPDSQILYMASSAVTPFNVLTPVTFSQPFTPPQGACICTPALRGDQRWLVKAIGGQPLTITADGGAVTVHDATGALVDSTIADPAAGAVYTVDATGAATYRLRIEGAEAAGVSTWMAQPAGEVSAEQATKWYFNTAPGEPLQVTLNSTEPLVYELIDPSNATVSGTATGSTAISGAAAPTGGTWTLLVHGASNPEAFLSFATQDGAGDRGAYLAWDSAGEGSLRLRALVGANAFTGPVTFTITGPKGFSATQTTSTGELLLEGLPTGAYQVGVQAPAGWAASTVSFTVNVLCAEEATQTIELTDVLAPTLTLPSNATVEATSAAGATYAFAASATDEGDSGVTAVCTPTSGATFALGTTTVSCSATDNAGNGASGSFTVTVRDTTAPTIAPIANIDVTATSAAGAVVTFAASATDAVTASPTIGYSHAPGSTFPVGATTVTVTATDAAGNTATRTFTITVAPLPYTAAAWARLRHAPTLNGRVNGSVWVMQPENVTLNSGAAITGDLILPGTPQLTRNGNPTLGATVDGFGAAAPTSHRLTLNGGTSIGRLVRRIDGVTLAPVAAPASPTGTRNVQLNRASDSAGSFATIRDLTLNGSVGTIAVPGGTYGTFTVNGSDVLRLGVAGSTTPTVYNFQQLVLNGASRLEIVGPVIVTVKQSIQANGSMGNASRPAWLDLRISNGGLTLNGSVSVYALVAAPAGEVIVNGGTKLVGRVAADRLTLNGNGLLDLVAPF